MTYKWAIRAYIAILITTLFFIIGCQPNLVDQPKQNQQLQSEEQPNDVEEKPILYTTLREDLSRTIGVLDPTELSSATSFLNKNLGNVRLPTWSHSYQEVLYAIQEDENTYSFGIVDAKGDNSRQLTDPFPFEGLVNAAWSFDDKYIAFIISPDRYALSTHALMLVDTEDDKSESRQLMSDGVWTYAWSPVNNQLAVVRWRSGSESGLYIIEVDGSQQDFFPASTFFPFETPTLINISWSSDGQQIAITNLPDEINSNTSEQTQVKEVYVINLETRTTEQLTNQQANLVDRSVSCLNWSPNGKKISFVSDYETSNGQFRQGALLVVDVESRVETQLAHYVVTWSCPVWSSDGEKIAFVSIDNPQNVNGDIYVAEVEINTIRRLTDNTQAKNDLSW